MLSVFRNAITLAMSLNIFAYPYIDGANYIVSHE